jgi:3-methyladenine DNA glycosylase AlkC
VTVKRKGAARMSAIPSDVLVALEDGTLETATLTEGLAIQMNNLMRVACPRIAADQIDADAGIVARMAQAGAILREGLSSQQRAQMGRHTSDTVRGWVAFAIGQDPTLSPENRLHAMRPFAADPHFGVREWAWMAVRAIIVAETEMAIKLLAEWTGDSDPHVRRFASEATRPRGVWAASIPKLRKAPGLGLPILEPLRFDPTRYVEDSVANWLNDAAKDQPDWLRALLRTWQQGGVSTRLIARAGRSLKVPLG